MKEMYRTVFQTVLFCYDAGVALFVLPLCAVFASVTYAVKLIGVSSQLGYLLDYLRTLFCKEP